LCALELSRFWQLAQVEEGAVRLQTLTGLEEEGLEESPGVNFLCNSVLILWQLALGVLVHRLPEAFMVEQVGLAVFSMPPQGAGAEALTKLLPPVNQAVLALAVLLTGSAVLVLRGKATTVGVGRLQTLTVAVAVAVALTQTGQMEPRLLEETAETVLPRP
jgi:hypothetical protein